MNDDETDDDDTVLMFRNCSVDYGLKMSSMLVAVDCEEVKQ